MKFQYITMINDHIRQSNLYKIMIEDTNNNDEEICHEISSYIATKVDIDIIDKLLIICDIKYKRYNPELIDFIGILNNYDIESIIDILDHIKFINNNNVLLFVIDEYPYIIRYRDCIQDILNNNYTYISIANYLTEQYICIKIIVDHNDVSLYSTNETIKFCLESTYIKELKCTCDVSWIIPMITLHNDLEVLEIYSPNSQLGCFAKLNNLHTLKINNHSHSLHFDYDYNSSILINVINSLENLSKLYIPYNMLSTYVDYSKYENLKELHLSNNTDIDEFDLYICELIDLNAECIKSSIIYIHLSDINKLTVLNSEDLNVFIVTDNPSKWNIVYNEDKCDTPNTIQFPNRTTEVPFIS